MKHAHLKLALMFVASVGAQAFADYGYDKTVGSRCTTIDAANDTTLDVYVNFTGATPHSISAEIVPSFDDNACTVKLPLGYTKFEGIKVALVKDIQTSSSQLTFTTINEQGTGQINHTFMTDGLGNPLEAGAEYQMRFDGMFSKADGTQYSGTLDTAYYSTSLPPVENLDIASDGMVDWTFPEGSYKDMKATISFYEIDVDGNRNFLVSAVKYPSTDLMGNYDYYDFANKLRNGNFVVVVTSSTKKFYDSVDQAKWGVPAILKFTTTNGVVTKKVAPSLEAADLVVSATVKPSSVVVGGKFKYNLTTINRGQLAAANTKLTLELPRNLAVVKTPKGCKEVTSLSVDCDLGGLGPRKKVTKKIVVKGIAKGEAMATISVYSDMVDADQEDNVIEKSVIVKPR
jgi:hypothetical protein